MRENHVKRLLMSGQPAAGAWLSWPSPPEADSMPQPGFDWLVCDTEHTPMDSGVTPPEGRRLGQAAGERVRS